MATCSVCGSPLKATSKFCSKCGTTVPAEPVQTPAPSPAGSIQGSLERLGLQLGRRQIGGLVLAVIVGVIVPRLMPYVLRVLYPLTSRILDSDPSLTRVVSLERFNIWLVTGLTFFSSFAIAFFAFRRRK